MSDNSIVRTLIRGSIHQKECDFIINHFESDEIIDVLVHLEKYGCRLNFLHSKYVTVGNCLMTFLPLSR